MHGTVTTIAINTVGTPTTTTAAAGATAATTNQSSSWYQDLTTNSIRDFSYKRLLCISSSFLHQDLCNRLNV